jgi:O-methyltransferase
MRRSMNDKATLLIVERALEQQNPALDAALSNLNMMVQNGGRERNTSEFDELLTTESFKLIRCIPGPLPFQILEAVAV